MSDEQRLARREPVLRSILRRYPSIRGVERIQVSQQEYDTLLDGDALPRGQAMTIMGKPVVVRP